MTGHNSEKVEDRIQERPSLHHLPCWIAFLADIALRAPLQPPATRSVTHERMDNGRTIRIITTSAMLRLPLGFRQNASLARRNSGMAAMSGSQKQSSLSQSSEHSLLLVLRETWMRGIEDLHLRFGSAAVVVVATFAGELFSSMRFVRASFPARS